MLNKQFGLEIKRVKKKQHFTNIANGLLFLLLKQGESMLLETWCLSMNDRYWSDKNYDFQHYLIL